MIVVDASVILAWSHRDEWTPEVERVIDRLIANGAIVPPVWTAEVANALVMAVRRSRLSTAERDELLANFRRLPIEIEAGERDRLWHDTVPLADRHDLTVYDATYLELALRRRLPLATLDEALARAARSEKLEVLP